MPSRKRNKGRARKAKNAGASGEDDQLLAHLLDQDFFKNMHCKHGFVPHPTHEEIIIKCLGAFIANWWDLAKTEYWASYWPEAGIRAMEITLSEFPAVWHEESRRKSLKESLFSSGTEFLLDGGINGMAAAKQLACVVAAAALVLEHYDSTRTADDVFDAPAFSKDILKYRDAIEGCDRSLFRFFKQRIPCSCLDKEYNEAKLQRAKTGKCGHCHERKERSTLKICGSCKKQQYCSTACQKEDWPSHKEDCMKWRKGVRGLKSK